MAKDFWEALARACERAGRHREPIALLLLRPPSVDGIAATVYDEIATGDMAVSLPGGIVAVLLHNAGDDKATALIRTIRARVGAPVAAGYAWALGDSGPEGLYNVTSSMLRDDAARVSPLARAS